MTFRLVLVGCGAAKRPEPAAARDLYTSTYFALKREWAETFGDDWLILSAEHGLLGPTEEVEPYDRSMGDLSSSEAAAWGGDVVAELLERVSPDRDDLEVVALAGRAYLDPIREDLALMSWTVRYPFDATSGIGEQMGLLSDAIEAAEAKREAAFERGLSADVDTEATLRSLAAGGEGADQS